MRSHSRSNSNRSSYILYTLGGVGSILIVIAIIVFMLSGNNSNEPKVIDASTLDVASQETNDELLDLEELSIREASCREFNNIRTYLFEVYNPVTGDVKKLNDGKLSIEKTTRVMCNFLNEHPNKTLSVGCVNNMFYIQQDISLIEDKPLIANILSISNNFTTDSWFDMTESIYNSCNVYTDSLFSCLADTGEKHYIYIYSEK